MGVSRQEYWSGLSFPSPGDLPSPGTEPGSPVLQADVGLPGGPDLGFGFPWKGGIPRPHQVTWSQPINMCLERKREPIRGKLKSLRTPKFEKSPGRFGPIRLLCKQVTNPLKPATNCLCTPYKSGNSLGSALSDPVPLLDARREPWLESAINFLFFSEMHCLGSLLSSRSGIRT